MQRPISAWPCFLAAAVSSLAAAGELKLADRTLTAPDGFEVELAAAPPVVDRPIVADFDEEGRLYVADSSGSSAKGEQQLQEKPHRILRLEDTDGDGRFDRSVVFADKMMFPEGTMWLEGSLYVAAPPSIWKLTDQDGDGVAERREEWFQGKTLTGCANDLHGPYRGPDGWIYWCKGAFAKQTYERPGKPPWVTRAAHIFRCRPDGTGIEPVMTGGMDNPVDVAFTLGGERIFTTTFFQQPEAGRRDGLIHAIYGGVYGKQHDALEGHPRTGELMPVLVHLGAAAPCGLTRYSSRVFGEDFQGNLFAALFNLRKVTRHVLEPEGATFRTRDSDFLASTSPDFHPTDVLEDADGSLLVVDTGGWYKICCPTSQLAKPDVLGGIYRVRRSGRPRLEDPRGLRLPWADLSPASLSELLAEERPAVRERAVQELARRGTAAVPALAAALERRGPGHSSARCHTVWALTRISDPSAREAVRAALADPDLEVRQAAIHSSGLWRDAGAAGQLHAILRLSSPQWQRAAAEALGRIGERSSVRELLEAAAKPRDRALEHSLTYALIEIADPAATAEGLAAASPFARRAALIALDQMEGGGLKPEAVTPLLSSADRVLQETASWITAHRPEWGGEVAGFLRRRLSDPGPGSPEGDELLRLLAKLSRHTAVQALLTGVLHDGAVPKPAILTSLRAMGQAGLKEPPAPWVGELARALGRSDPELLREAVATARAWSSSKECGAELAAALLRLARDPSTPTDLRLEALAAARGGLSGLEQELLDFLLGALDPGQPVAARSAAASVLARTRLGPPQLRQLVQSLKTVGPLEFSRLLGAFEGSTDEALGLELVAALKESSGSSGLRADMIKPLLAKFPASVQRQGEELAALLKVDAAQEKAHLEELAAKMKGGDVRRGQAVFLGTRAACSSCHAIGYLGGKVGPDLTTIGKVRTERDLLESIVYPSSSFVRSYEPLVVVTRSGEVFSGVLRNESSDEVLLATGPNTEARIARADILEMKPGEVSLMPQGMDQQLRAEDLADLIAFLKANQ